MNVTQFFKSVRRRLILSGALLMVAGTVALFAQGEREGWKSDKHRKGDAVTFYPPGTAFVQNAVPSAPGGFISPLITTSEAKTLADETPVRLQGNITQALKDEQYEFRDSAGAITVKIGRRAWNGLSVNSHELIEITGIVEKSFSTRMIKARAIQKIQSDTLP
jgi:uncharacterized protein (TIGR00156 family)